MPLPVVYRLRLPTSGGSSDKHWGDMLPNPYDPLAFHEASQSHTGNHFTSFQSLGNDLQNAIAQKINQYMC